MTKNGLSPELGAMAQIETALADLEEEQRVRVLQWAVSRFRGPGKPAKADDLADGNLQAGPSSYASLAEFYDAASPVTEQDRALVAAYWIQHDEGASDVDAQKVNSELKHLGHGVSNITRAFDVLKSQKPALIMQTRKAGKTKQARKKYKVTDEGRKAIERMMSASHE